MQNSLSKILESTRTKSQSESEKGEYFEQVVKVYLENNTLQGQSYDKVWSLKEWAKERGLPEDHRLGGAICRQPSAPKA